MRQHWRTNPAMADSGQDIGIVVGIIHDLVTFLDMTRDEQDRTVVVFSEYSQKHDIEPNKFIRMFPRTEKDLIAGYETMKQFLFTLLDYTPLLAINSKTLTDFECVRILQELGGGEKVKAFVPFDEFVTLLSPPLGNTTTLFGDDLIQKDEPAGFCQESGFHVYNAPLYYALFGGRYTKRAVSIRKSTFLKNIPDLATRPVSLKEFLAICRTSKVPSLQKVAEFDADKIHKSFMFYCGYENIKPVHLQNVSGYLKTKKSFNETKFTVALYKLGAIKHLRDDFEIIKGHMRRLSEF